MTITTETVGRRIYFRGNTFPVRGVLDAGGATFDGEQRAWYVGTQRAELAEQLLAKVNGQLDTQAQQEREAGISQDAEVIRGRVEYQGKTYYLLADGISEKTGKPYMKIAFRDGSKVFWAKPENIPSVRILKRYREPTSIRALRAFAEKARTFGTEACRCFCHREANAGKPGSILYDGCDRCGCEVSG